MTGPLPRSTTTPLPRAVWAVFAMALLALGLLCLPLFERGPQRASPRAEAGVLDLSAWSFEQHGPAKLSGQWEFQWGGSPVQHGPLNPDGPMDFYPAPSLWKGATALGRPVSPHGLAAYRLRVRLKPGAGPKALYLAGVLSVCRVWVDGRLIGQNGDMGQGGAPESPRRHILLPRFTPTGDTAQIVLEVSNHTNVQGGLNTAIFLGAPEQIERMASERWITGAFIAGILLAMAAYHLVVFFMRRSDKSNLYFGLFCLAWSVATLFSPANGFLVSQYASLPWRWHIDLALLPYGFTIPLMVVFYHALFPKRWGRAINTLYAVLGAAYVAFLLGSAPNAFGQVPLAYYMLTRTAFLYLFAAFALDMLHRERGVAILAPGYLALACAELSKILFDLHITRSPGLAPYGMLAFILSYSVFMSVRFSQAFLALEENISLKREVALRRRTEQDLRLRQLRLSRMLDAMSEAVVAVNQSREIAFCNQAFETLTGRRAQQVLGQPLALLLAASAGKLLDELGPLLAEGGRSASFAAVEWLGPGKRAVACSVYATSLEVEDEPLLLMSLRTGGGGNETDATLPAETLREVEDNRQRLQRLEEALLALEASGSKEALLSEMRGIDALLENIAGRLNGAAGGEDARRLAVRAMQTSVDCWAKATGLGKGELAAQSGLWNVYMERDGYLRTQTLDKYLSGETLPQRPRWRQILATADFVLTACPEDSRCRQELQSALARLKHLA